MNLENLYKKIDIYHACHVDSVHIGYLDNLLKTKSRGEKAFILKTDKIKNYFGSAEYIDLENKNINLNIQNHLKIILNNFYKEIIEIDYSIKIDHKSNNYSNLEEIIRVASRSAVCSCSKESFPESLYELETFYKKDIESCILVWDILDNLNKRYKINNIYIFNGRIPIPATISHFSETKNINFTCFEDGYSSITFSTINYIKNHKKIIHNFSSLDHFLRKSPTGISELIRNFFKSFYGLIFFYSRIYNRVHQLLNNLVPSQYKNFSERIAFVNNSRKKSNPFSKFKYFLYTPSTSYEIAGMEQKCLIHKDQENLENSLKKFISILPNNYKLVVRFHPNNFNVDSSGISNTKKILRKYLDEKKLIFISPGKNISSYELIKNAEFVFSGISTCVVEANIIGTPSRAFWMAPYSSLLPELVLENLNELNLNKLKKITYRKSRLQFLYRIGLYGYALNNSNTPNIRVFFTPIITINLLKRILLFLKKSFFR